MNRYWRKRVAVSLSWILLLLSVTAELSHQHGFFSAESRRISNAENNADEAEAKPAYAYDCVGCLYAATHVAVTAVAQFAAVEQPCHSAHITQTVFHSFFVFTPFNLRAPPAFLA